ncbi:MAG TPA: MarR family transcriptional regulator [Caulobacteraceae bacterium]|nr:MarR family transcriptional regulator [Caulobacteraceae bacterium]
MTESAGMGSDHFEIPHTAPEALKPYVELLSRRDKNGLTTDKGRLGLLLVWLADDLQAFIDTYLFKHRISEKKLDVLILIALAEAKELGEELLSPSGIAEYLGVQRTTVTGILDWLEQRGLIRRSNHPADRRRIQAFLTDAGRTLLRRSGPALWEGCVDLANGLDDKDRRDLDRVLTKLWVSTKSRLGVLEPEAAKKAPPHIRAPSR